MLNLALAIAVVLIALGAAFGQEKPMPADPLVQCHAMVGILDQERRRAQADLATYAARVEQLTAEKAALEAKAKAQDTKDGH